MNTINRINGMKVIKRWSAGTIFTSLFVLIAIGGLGAALWYLPLFRLGDSINGSAYTFHNVYAKDYIKYLLANFTPYKPGTAFNYFNDTYLTNLFANLPENLTPLKTYFPIVFNYAVFGFIAIIALLGVISVIFALVGLIFGVFPWKAPKGLMWAVFAFQLILSLIVVAMHFTLKGLFMGKEIADIGKVGGVSIDILYPLAYVGGLFFVSIILSIIYSCAFKNRIYIKEAMRILEAQKARQEMMAQQMQPINYGMGNMPVGGVAMQPIVIQTQPNQTPAKPVEPVVVPPSTNPTVITQVKYASGKGLPEKISSIGGHAFSQNENLEIAVIPLGITEIGPSAFSNCPNLKVVSIPISVSRIGYNAFFGCKRLARINYGGRKSDWKNIQRGSNWLASAGTTIVVCVDGSITVNPYH